MCVPPSIGAGLEAPIAVDKYGLEIEGKLAGFFTSVDGIGSESEVVTSKSQDPDTGETITRKSPGRVTLLDVVLEREVTTNMDLHDWRQLVVAGKIDAARRNFSIIAYSQTNEELARWSFESAWPMKISTSPVYDTPDSTTGYMIETVTITHEGYERVN